MSKNGGFIMEEAHFLTMIQAAQPHVSGRPKRSLELIIQSAGLMHSVHNYQEPTLSACDASQDKIDFEGLLTDLQPICNPAEAELVNLILNFFRSKKIYSAYMDAMQKPADESADNNTFPVSHSTESRDEVRAAQVEDAIEVPTMKTEAETAPPSGMNGRTAWKHLMENHMFQSLLSPTQKNNLNQIGNFMDVIQSGTP